jgi:hypothetical protein
MRNKFNNNACDLESVLKSLKDAGVNVIGERKTDYILIIDENRNEIKARDDFNIFSAWGMEDVK